MERTRQVVLCLATLVLASQGLAMQTQATSTREERLRESVNALATAIGERHTRRPESLRQAESWVADQLGKSGAKVVREPYEADGQTVANVYIEIKGTREPNRWIIVGAHYDSAQGTPGANDNGTGVAALVELAQSLAADPLEKSIRFVAFVNEEPPFFQTGAMGSLIHADGCKQRGEAIDAMISIETIGCFSNEPNSQHFPLGLSQRFPTTGNFIAIVGDPSSQRLATQVHETFAQRRALPAERAILPRQIPGVGWSDHWSFWQHDYQAVMITDTAPFRYPHYHQKTDTPDQIDYPRTVKVVDGLEAAIKTLASSATTQPSEP